MPIITSVQPMSNFKIKVKFNNGTVLTLDMKYKLKTIRFQQLRDKGIFCSAITDGYSIRWNEFVEISVTEIFEMAQMNM